MAIGTIFQIFVMLSSSQVFNGQALALPYQLPTISASTYQLTTAIAGEMALNRQQYKLASELYLNLAKSTYNPRFAERATYIALISPDPHVGLEPAMYWAEQSPQHVTAQRIATLLMLQTKQPKEKVLPILERVFDFSSHPNDEVISLFYALKNKPEQKRLLSFIESLIEEHPGEPNRVFSAAIIYSQLSRPDKAMEILDKYIKDTKVWSEPIILRAELLILNKRFNKAGDYLKDKIEKIPDAGDIRIKYVELLMDSNDVSTAKKHLAILKNNPDYLGVTSIYLAKIALMDTEIRDAKKHLKNALKDPGQKNRARYILGRIAEIEEKFKEAISWYLGITPSEDYIEGQIRAAKIYSKLKKIPEGMEVLEQSTIATEQEFIKITIAKSNLLSSVNKMNEAMAIVEKNLSSFPKSIDLLYHQGMLALDMNNLKLFESSLKRILQINPEHINSLNALGFILADRTERVDEALKHLTKALQLSPDNPLVLDSLGWAHYRSGNHQQALLHLENAYQIKPTGSIAAHLGEVLWISGSKKKAKNIWDKALKDNPRHGELIQTRKSFIKKTP